MSATLKPDLEAHKPIEANRRSLEESQLSIVKRALKSHTPAQNGASVKPASSARSRQTGNFIVRLAPRSLIVGSQKEAYLKMLKWLHEEHPNLFEILAEKRTRKGRRIIARSRAALYPRPHLQQHAHCIAPGWYVDLNLSKAQKIQRLRLACAEAGYTYGVEADAGL